MRIPSTADCRVTAFPVDALEAVTAPNSEFFLKLVPSIEGGEIIVTVTPSSSSSWRSAVKKALTAAFEAE